MHEIVFWIITNGHIRKITRFRIKNDNINSSTCAEIGAHRANIRRALAGQPRRSKAERLPTRCDRSKGNNLVENKEYGK